MPWNPPAFISGMEMLHSGHRYRRETESLWICSECGAQVHIRDASMVPFFAVLQVGDKIFSSARGDFNTCKDAQAMIVLHS